MRREAGPGLVLLASNLLVAGWTPMLAAQGLPEFHPINPVVESRSGLYFQPLVAPDSGWRVALSLDYASMAERNFRFSEADTSYLLDAEGYRLGLGISRDLGRYDFLLADLSLGGVYAGGLDGFLDWYHGLLGISFPERDDRPHNKFDYFYRYSDGTRKTFSSSNLHLNDIRIGAGHRFSPSVQSVLSLSLPTSTAPEGYGRGTVSVSLLTTARTSIKPRLTYEGEVGLGYTPRHGALEALQNQTFLALSSGLRYRFTGRQSLYTNLYWASPQYDDAGAPALEKSEFEIDFGWILRTRSGHEWRVGLTEDLFPSGPGIDLIMRVGTNW